MDYFLLIFSIVLLAGTLISENEAFSQSDGDCCNNVKCCQTTNKCNPCTNTRRNGNDCCCCSTETDCPTSRKCNNCCSTSISTGNNRCCCNTSCQDTQNCCDVTTTTTTTTTTDKPSVVTLPSRVGPSPSTKQSADVKVENTLSNQLQIHIPITITNENINTFNFARRVPDSSSEPIHSSSTIGIHPTSVTVTPAPIVSSDRPERCCNVIVPCLGGGCQTHHRTCGPMCMHQNVYLPVNPCARVPCSRHDFYNRYACSSSWHYPYFGCSSRRVDCHECTYDFYQHFDTYNRCSGCFYY